MLEKVIGTILDSRKKSTNLIYSKIWKKFCSSWKEKVCKVFGSVIPAILDFLQDTTDLGLAPNTLKVQVAALSNFLDLRLADNSDKVVH